MNQESFAECFCPHCGKNNLVVRKAKYDGFTKVGETVQCAVCGQDIEEADVEPSKPVTPAIFTDEDRSPALSLFEEGENRCLCRYCAHYIVNPFRQWCSFHKKDVEATDTCDRFAASDKSDDE